jgi:hypothetical protein
MLGCSADELSDDQDDVPHLSGNMYDPEWTKRSDSAGNPFLVVVDRTGMHLLPAIWCECRNAAGKEMQALDLGLYPASDKMIRTVFTFQCLDDYLADSQECNTSAYHYNEKLRRLTNSSFPQTAPVILLPCHFPFI